MSSRAAKLSDGEWWRLINISVEDCIHAQECSATRLVGDAGLGTSEAICRTKTLW